MSLFDRITGKSPAPKSVSDPSAKQGDASNAGFFGRFKKGVQKTAQLLNTDIRDLFKQQGRLVDDEFLGELVAILIRTDMGVGPAAEIRDQVKAEFRGRVVQMSEVLDVIKKNCDS